jgi:hypothetical protein
MSRSDEHDANVLSRSTHIFREDGQPHIDVPSEVLGHYLCDMRREIGDTRHFVVMIFDLTISLHLPLFGGTCGHP